MGKKVMKLFLDTMLRAAVIILAVAIVVMLVLLARTVSKAKKTDDTAGKKEASSIVTEEADPSDPTFGGGGDAASDDATEAVQDTTDGEETGSDARNAKVVVLNASGVSGVAATWQTTFTAAGFTSVDIGTYDGETQSSTTIYTSDSYDVSEIARLLSSPSTAQRTDISDSVASDVDISTADIVVVIGIDNAANN